MLLRLVKVFLLLCFIPPMFSFALPANYLTSIEKNLYIAKNKSSAYVWGAAGTEKDGVLQVDCSGLIYHLFKQSGIAVRRSQALRMRMGLDGWTGRDVKLDDADHLNLIWWTWKDKNGKVANPARPHGHIGILSEDSRTKLIEAVHASSGKGRVVSQQVRGQLLRDISAIRVITIGDKK